MSTPLLNIDTICHRSNVRPLYAVTQKYWSRSSRMMNDRIFGIYVESKTQLVKRNIPTLPKIGNRGIFPQKLLLI